MKPKWQLFFFTVILLLLSFIGIEKWIHPKDPGSYYLSIPIGLSETNTPYLNLEIGKQKVLACLDLGFSGDLAVNKEILTEIADKSFISQDLLSGWTGKNYRTDLYKIPEIQIGSLCIYPVLLHEENSEFAQDTETVQTQTTGRLGWKIFNKNSLFLDLKNLRIIFCDGIETLKNHGHCVAHFVKTPLLLDQNSLEIDTITPHGLLRCILDTGSTWNILPDTHSASDPKDLSMEKLCFYSKNTVTFPSFQIHRHEFGPISFRHLPIQFPFKVDAILGMEFFLEHQVLIDFPNQQIYFAKAKILEKPEKQTAFSR